jgi:hypothetical protein
MKVSHEVPKCLLNNSPEFNDYDYCLPHLLDKDKHYLKYFREAKAKGRYIIMDNSLHELGEAYDHKPFNALDKRTRTRRIYRS